MHTREAKIKNVRSCMPVVNLEVEDYGRASLAILNIVVVDNGSLEFADVVVERNVLIEKSKKT